MLFRSNDIEGSPMFMTYTIDNWLSLLFNETTNKLISDKSRWVKEIKGSYHMVKGNIFNDNPYFQLKSYDYSNFNAKNIIIPNDLTKYVKFHGAEITRTMPIWQHENMLLLYENQKKYEKEYRFDYNTFLNTYMK